MKLATENDKLDTLGQLRTNGTKNGQSTDFLRTKTDRTHIYRTPHTIISMLCKKILYKISKSDILFLGEINTLSFEAPAIPQDTTIWDAYYAMAMVISDYWFSINGDMDKAAMMAYEVVSDIDRK